MEAQTPISCLAWVHLQLDQVPQAQDLVALVIAGTAPAFFEGTHIGIAKREFLQDLFNQMLASPAGRGRRT